MMERYKGYWITGSADSWTALYSLLGIPRGPQLFRGKRQRFHTKTGRDCNASHTQPPCSLSERRRLVEGYYLSRCGFEYVASALLITVVLVIGWKRTYWNG